jgi:flagellum-specific peptidoglycan hydrolase FlgJ
MKTFNQFINEANSDDAQRRAYFNKIYRQAKSSGDRFPELVAAQAALESGWGSSPSGKNNYFGQKAGDNEPGTVRRTREVYGGKDAYIDAKFKDYDDESASVKDRIKKWSYKYGDAKDVETAASRLQLPGGAEIPGSKEKSHGAYATDPNYVSTVSRIARDYKPSDDEAPTPTKSNSKPKAKSDKIKFDNV